MANANPPTFKPETMQALLKNSFNEPSSTKISKDAVALAAESLRLFTVEAIRRSVTIAEQENKEDIGHSRTLVEARHLERIYTQLLLEF
ncbi:hypothetical protein M427DRAFT_53823 [Gonapodya prolifera JEL478]|uniref:Transcription factor CBF/NF-Y/archaeal histone domain-containing protein n=1 Tax=Gonapodya prolifera (strain JEL478) TaxID=1344416 RepID=A0A139ANW2_GONPJ|nr:hypothetical protein M427DRAFT_53823 [Gonapodya prolifera JEL478]|eukprot:KXS18439.1 hypothetical protein M427DRAFT_53823 [Gonapodya prolifera JEL478]